MGLLEGEIGRVIIASPVRANVIFLATNDSINSVSTGLD
jgi:hypothetical protein